MIQYIYTYIYIYTKPTTHNRGLFHSQGRQASPTPSLAHSANSQYVISRSRMTRRPLGRERITSNSARLTKLFLCDLCSRNFRESSRILTYCLGTVRA